MFNKLTTIQKRSISLLILIIYSVQIFLPTVAFALTSGPAQPEYTSFEPVATTNMVNPMSGDFNYNLPLLQVPGPNGGGYAMSLSYHSGVSMDEDASWVGYGWTLNPGAINRAKKGVPDDYNGRSVKNLNFTKNNSSITAGPTAGVDILTFFSLDASRSIRYNNYKGYAAINSLSVGIADGLLSIGYNNASDVGSSYSVNINPAALLEKGSKKARASKKAQLKKDLKNLEKSKDKDQIKSKKDEITKLDKADSKLSGAKSALNSLGSSFAGYMTDDPQYPVSVSSFTGSSVNVSFSVGFTATPLDIPFRLGVSGNVTTQNPSNEISNNAYGMLYHDVNKPNNALLDYSVEKEAAFNKRDIFMPVPFSAEDDFNVTGEGLGGAFKLNRKPVPVFSPPNQKSSSVIANLNGDLQLGLDIGGGVAVGVGKQDLEVSSQGVQIGGISPTDMEQPYFVFSGDKAGNKRHTLDDNVNNVYLSGSGLNPSVKFRNDVALDNSRDERGSFIGHHTNAQLVADQSATYKRMYQKRADVEAKVTRSGTDYQDLIGELSTVNEDGNRYVYGIPVYTRNEESKSYFRPEGGGGSCVPINRVVHYNANNVSNGHESFSPYASTYLLTEITTPDYIDRTFNGPSNDDFGGWTKFTYDKEYGNSSNNGSWYSWRMPYNGLTYEKGTLSDVRDDMGSFTRGEKEIYYVKEIETRTHKAVFILNDPVTEPRYDGLAAEGEGLNVRQNKAARDLLKPLRYLKKIELYVKDPTDPTKTIGKPIKTVNFQYYDAATSLCKNLPNGIDISGGTAGKLTLKKVWFEYEGISKSTISPYEFIYEYKKLAPSPTSVGNYFRSDGAVNANYPLIVADLNKNYDENPNYDPNGVDAWNNLAYNGNSRNMVMQPWVYQGARTVGAVVFDPGAWNLKTIKLPSGGQILVQYEEHDYKFVQNLPANALTSLVDNTSNQDGGAQTFTVNLADLGIDPNTTQGAQEATDYAAYLNAYYSSTQYTYLPSKKIYFKFLYNLVRNDNNVPQVSSCGSEYITGYCKMNGASYNTGTKTLSITLDTKDGISSPQYACRDFYLNNRAMLNVNNECNNPDVVDADGSAIDLVTNMVGNLFVNFKNVSREVGKKINPVYSYLKLPMPQKKSKLGGGIRVKRIMMYDAGLTAAEETLYGTEYLYKQEDGTSSGVATNEPVKEENALVYSLDKRMPQNLAQKMLSGEDKDEFEGPIGENLLPGPSVIYSRVVTKSIYNGASSPGFTVNEYYTVKDYPSFKIDYSGVDEKNPFLPNISAILVNLSYKIQSAAQNYTFITNDMHGKPKRTVRFGGNYPANPADFNENYHKVAYQEQFDYYEPGKNIPVLNSAGVVEYRTLGVEEKVAVEAKNVEDVTDNFGLNINTSVGYLAIVVLPQLWLSGHYSHSERKLKSAVSSKIVHYQSYLKGTTVTKDGLSYRTENRLFDRLTGDPIATVTTDEYNDLTINNTKQKGVYTSYKIPAHYVYPSFGLRSNNEGWSKTETVSATSFTTANINRYFVGDLLSVGGILCFVTGVNTSTNVVSFSVAITGTVPTGGQNVTVLNSGNRNALRSMAGEITCYGNDDMNSSNSGVAYGPFTNIPNVISASATVFTDTWTQSAYDKNLYGTTTGNVYLTGEKGKWRQSSTYVFKASPLLASAKAYNTGYYAYQKFDYTTLSNNNSNSWVRGNLVVKYSPHGEVLEEENIINVPTAAKFAHGENVPSIIAQNARFANILFASFEDKSGSGIITDKKIAHTGNQCVLINPSQVLDPTLTGGIEANAQVLSKGLLLRYWSKSASGTNQALVATVKKNDASAQVINTTISTKSIARVGEWSLFETSLVFPTGSITVNSPIRVELSNGSSEIMYMDDYKLQPTESQTTSYVYDYASLKLLATFDDRHFALIYQYDAEGKLVRKLVETERGVKTISETQYNSPESAR